MPSFVCVRIPCDPGEALEEWTIEYTADTVVGCLTERLKEHFRARSDADPAAQRATFEAQLREQMGDRGGASLTPEVLDALMTMGSVVDTIPLVLNKPDTGYEAVTLYVDDRGVAKQLPRNARASDMVALCGRQMDVMGDAFVSRFVDDDADLFERRDFRLSELDSGADWVARARATAAQSAANGARVFSAAGAAGAAAPRRECARPGCSAEGTQRCSRCRAVHYCGVQCQRKHWKAHKVGCQAGSSS